MRLRVASLTWLLALCLFVPASRVCAAPARAASSRRFRILILRPKLVRNADAYAANSIYPQVEKQVRELFPCASVRTVDDVVFLANYRTSVVQATSMEDPWMWEKQVEMFDAEMILDLEFGSTGTTHESPGRYARATMINVATGKVPMRNQFAKEGWKWSSSDFVEEIMEPLRAMKYQVCPWVGTIEYSRSANIQKNEVVPDGDGEGVHTTTLDQHEEDRWTLTLSQGKPGEPFNIDGEGSGSMTSKGLDQTKWASRGCFPQDKNGVVRDSGYVSNVSDQIDEVTEESGSSASPLRKAKVELTPGEYLNVPVFTLTVEAWAKGTSEARSVTTRAGGCGTWRKEGPRGTGLPFGRMIAFTKDRLSGRNDKIEAHFVLMNTGGVFEEVTVKLTRE